MQLTGRRARDGRLPSAPHCAVPGLKITSPNTSASEARKSGDMLILYPGAPRCESRTPQHPQA